jgi:hypothetical protein
VTLPTVVDENRNLFPTLAYPIDETGRLALSRHIYCLGKKPISIAAEEMQRLFHVLGASRHECDAVAASQKAAYDGKPNAACSSGHKGNGPIALTHLRLPGFNAPARMLTLTPSPEA